MEIEYIRLPVVKKIEVLGYRLFKGDWRYEFKKGLNLFVGGNRLGKTTTVYILLYGLIGISRTERTFFTNRVPPQKQSKDVSPSVRLQFDIGDNSIEIERDLSNSNIIYLSINGTHYPKDTPDIEDVYLKEVVRLSGISSIDDYRDLLAKFLIREEEGTSLLWDANSQIKILRLLFNYGKYASEIEELTKNNSQKVRQFLEGLFSKGDKKDRIKATEYLIKYQDLDALRFYVDWMKEKKEFSRSLFDSSPLRSLRIRKAIPLLMELLALSYEEDFKQPDTFDRLDRLVLDSLTVIAFESDENYLEVKKSIEFFIDKYLSVYQNVNWLYAFLDQLEQKYYINKSEQFEIGEVVQKLEEIHF